MEERIVTPGETIGQQVEITTGLSKGESVAADPKGRLSDGALVRVR